MNSLFVIIRLNDVSFAYAPENAAPVQALKGVSLEIKAGEYVVVLGHNGSGKSTLAKHLNGLLVPSEGEVLIKRLSTRDRQHLRTIRQTVGMVFQNPDNQFVATIVEEDVAFGPENLGLARDEIVARVNWSLDRVELAQYRGRPPHQLSGGQKQRACIAGVLAMRPEVLVLDEATAMLDPLGRREVLAVARQLNRGEGVTVVAITHHMDEALEADRVIVMSAGQIVLQGTPREVFTQVERLRELHLDVPQPMQLAHALRARGIDFPSTLTPDELVAALRSRPVPGRVTQQAVSPDPAPALIEVHNLQHFYMRGTPLEVQALHDVTLDVRQGEILGIIGQTGSGKSTIVQHFNALMTPHGGRVVALGMDLGDPGLDVRALRKRIGLVFQSPEAQLFEQYVGDDVAYGPRNLKLSRDEVRARVRKAMDAVGLPFEAFKDRITFALSGGQMRRVALAGVLALEPEVLVLDEPTAGLDPAGRDAVWDLVRDLRARGLTVVVISHNMDELAAAADRLVVIADGRVAMTGTAREIFAQSEALEPLRMLPPAITHAFRVVAGAEAPVVLSVDEALELIGHGL
jgi:energy-coupling factor transport system ATP-binding protein